MKKTFITTVFIINLPIVTNLKSQISVIKPNIESSEMIEVLSHDISQYTGRVNVKYDIFKINVGNLEIPISLNYSTNGIKPSELSSNIGIGWSLSYGGIITRITRDKADDSVNGYLHTNTYENFSIDKIKRQNILNQTIYEPSVDLVPDEFNYQANASSGIFYIDQFSKNTILQKFSNYKINYQLENNILNSFSINDDVGNTYYYGNLNNNNAYSSIISKGFVQKNTPAMEYHMLGNEESLKDTWYISKIITNTNEIIEYKYEDEDVHYFQKNYDKIIKPSMFGSSDSSSPYDAPGIYTYFSEIWEHKKRLKEIVWRGGRVIFLYNESERQDLDGSNALSHVIVNDMNGVLIKKVKLSQSYNENISLNNNVNVLLKTLDPTSEKKMFLDKIEEYYKMDKVVKKTNYLYSNKNNIPNRFTTSLDSWGYYNGKPNGNYISLLTDDQNENDNRGVELEYLKIGTLDSIVEYLGATTVFNFETNNLKAGFDASNIITQNGYVPNATNNTTSIRNVFLSKANINIPSYNLQENYFYKNIAFPITLTSPQKIKLEANVLIPDPDVLPGGLKCHQYTGEIYEDTQRITLSSFPTIDQIHQGQSITSNVLKKDKSYQLRVYPIDCDITTVLENPIENFRFSVTWTENNPISPLQYDTDINGPGLRVKNIQYIDVGNLLTQTDYTYLDSSGKSSGILFGINEYEFIIGKTSQNVPILYKWGVGPGSILMDFNGSDYGYSVVEETTKSANESKKITYTFSNFKDPNSNIIYPSYFRSSNKWARGNLISKTLFKSLQNESYSKVSESIYNYKYAKKNSPDLLPGLLFLDTNSTISNLQTSIDENYFKLQVATFYRDFSYWGLLSSPASNYEVYLDTNTNPPIDMYYKNGFILGGRVELEKSTTSNYFDSKEIKSKTALEYYSGNNTNISSILNQLGDYSIKTNLKYAQNSNNQYLISKNMVSIPLNTTNIKVENGISTIISDKETLYPISQLEADQKTNGLPLPYADIIKNIEIGNELLQISYDKYDQYGNLVQYTDKNGISTTVIWGYNQTSPIAKIEGAKYSDVQALIQNSITKSNADIDQATEGQLIAELDLLRKNLAPFNFQVTTYTYDPLIGVTSITPPSGIREIYKYDAANRLEKVVDINGNILKEYNYNYKQ